MRHISDEGLAIIKRFEGFSPKRYLCPAGLPTIGYGHLIKAGESFDEIDIHEANELLRRDVNAAERAVLRLTSVPLSDNQFAALVGFTFNLGAGAYQRSTLRKKVNREEHGQVPAEFMKWVLAGGRKLTGLIKRRQAEATLYAS